MRKFILLQQNEKDGSYIEILSTKSRYIHFANAWDVMCDITRGYLGGHGSHQDWMWRLPLSKKKDEDGFYLKTLGSQLYNLESSVLYKMLENRLSLEKIHISENFYSRLTAEDRERKLLPEVEKILNSKNGIKLVRTLVKHLDAGPNQSASSQQ